MKTQEQISNLLGDIRKDILFLLFFFILLFTVKKIGELTVYSYIQSCESQLYKKKKGTAFNASIGKF